MSEVQLPADPIFCPALRLSLFDTRLGGRLRPNVGNCRVELKDKVPWSDSYRPPRRLKPPTPPLEEAKEGGGEREGEEAGNDDDGEERMAREAAEDAGAEESKDEGGAGGATPKLIPEYDSGSAFGGSTDKSGLGAASDGSYDVRAYERTDGADTHRLQTQLGEDQKKRAGEEEETAGKENSDEEGGVSESGESVRSGETFGDGEDDDDVEKEGLVNENHGVVALAAPKDEDELVAALRKALPFEDDGTGVFGDLPRLEQKWKSYNRRLNLRDRRRAALFGGLLGGGKGSMDDLLLDDETASEIAEQEEKLREKGYLSGRAQLGEALEAVFAERDDLPSPFERYDFSLGNVLAASDPTVSDLLSKSSETSESVKANLEHWIAAICFKHEGGFFC